MTSVGLQTQYEAVCENLGLIAYLVQVLIFVINAVIIVTVNDIDKNLTLEKRVSTRRIEDSFLFLFSIYEIVNKQARKLQATLVRNYESLTHRGEV